MLVGLTGGIGSGKTAADYFAELGIDVVDADLASRAVVEPGKPALEKLQNTLGRIFYCLMVLSTEPNYARLYSPIIGNANGYKVFHPLIRDHLQAQIAASTSSYCLLVNPLLLESGQGQWCDEIVVVDVPETLQIERTMARDDNSRSQVESIMAAQMTREARREKASKVINNDQDLMSLYKQVETLHRELLQK